MTDFRKHLWHALWKAGLFPIPDVYCRCSEEIRRQGADEYTRLAGTLGTETWGNLMAAWGRPHVETLCIHQLGSGRMQTAFCIAPLGLPADIREPLVRLGAIGNLIVALYDDLVDEHLSDADLLTRSALLSTMTDGPSQSFGRHAVAELVALFFRSASALSGGNAPPAVRHCLNRAVVSMYDAECETLTNTNPAKLKIATRRKSALPAVVMGLPAWLVSNDFNSRQYFWHLRWLYAFGDFCGLVDDSLDLDEDAKTGHPNCVQTWLDAPHTSATEVAARIASYGQRIRADWDAHTPISAKTPFLTETMTTCLGLAFGGSTRLTNERR